MNLVPMKRRRVMEALASLKIKRLDLDFDIGSLGVSPSDVVGLPVLEG